MTDEKLREAYQQLGRLSAEALDEGKHHDAFRYAVAAYSIVPDSEQHWKTNFLILVDKICGEFLTLRSEERSNNARDRRREKHVCSFCGKKEPEVKLVPGPDWVFICNSCVNSFYNGFKN
jgi:hypothetical protein